MTSIEDEARALAQEAIMAAGRAMVADLAGEMERADRVHEAFRTRLLGHWAVPLGYYFKAWQVCRQLGADITISEEANPALVEALVGLHARACRVGLEVYHLLRDGHPQAAGSRARTLYELAVHSELIEEEPGLAPRFLAHADIQRRKDAQDYNASGGFEEPFSEEELEGFTAKAEKAIAAHPGIQNQNGWATLDGQRQKFRQLVERTSMRNQYPYYNLFSHEVHAGSRASILNTFKGPNGITHLAGCTNAGLAAPGQTAILCLVRVTDDLRSACRDESKPLTRVALHSVVNRANDSFAEAELELDTTEAPYVDESGFLAESAG